MSEKYVYISGMDEVHGPMPESEAWAMANDQNRLTLEINADKTDGVYTVAIVLDHLDYKPSLWSFTEEHPSELNDIRQPDHRWIFRNDEPAHEAEAHAYEHDVNLSVCGNYNRATFDWTEMDGERCIECQRIIGEPT